MTTLRARARALGAAAVIALLAGGPAPARADDSEAAAAEIFKAAAAAYARRDFRAAALSFETAFQKAPHGGAMYNAGLAWEAAKEAARAADAYQAALDTPGLDGAKTKDAQRRLARLEKQLARVEVSAPDGATVWLAHAEGVPAPAQVHVAPGKHEVTVDLPGGESETRTVEAQAGEVARVDIQPPPKPALPAPAPAPAPPPLPPRQVESSGSAQRAVGWVAIGAGGLSGVAGAVMGFLTVDALDDFEMSGRTDEAARDRALSLRAGTNVALIGAGVLGAAGILLVLTAPSPRAPAEPRASAGLCLSPRGGALCGRF